MNETEDVATARQVPLSASRHGLSQYDLANMDSLGQNKKLSSFPHLP